MNYQVNLLRDLHAKVVRGEPALIGSALQDAANQIERLREALRQVTISADHDDAKQIAREALADC